MAGSVSHGTFCNVASLKENSSGKRSSCHLEVCRFWRTWYSKVVFWRWTIHNGKLQQKRDDKRLKSNVMDITLCLPLLCVKVCHMLMQDWSLLISRTCPSLMRWQKTSKPLESLSLTSLVLFDLPDGHRFGEYAEAVCFFCIHMSADEEKGLQMLSLKLICLDFNVTFGGLIGKHIEAPVDWSIKNIFQKKAFKIDESLREERGEMAASPKSIKIPCLPGAASTRSRHRPVGKKCLRAVASVRLWLIASHMSHMSWLPMLTNCCNEMAQVFLVKPNCVSVCVSLSWFEFWKETTGKAVAWVVAALCPNKP